MEMCEVLPLGRRLSCIPLRGTTTTLLAAPHKGLWDPSKPMGRTQVSSDT